MAKRLIDKLLGSKKTLYVVAFIWLAARSLLPDTHVDPQGSYIQLASDELALWFKILPSIVAAVLIFGMAYPKLSNSKWWEWLLGYKTWMILGYCGLLILSFLAVAHYTIIPIAIRGSVLSLGVVILVAMITMVKLKDEKMAVPIGMMAGFLSVGVYEIIYQITRYACLLRFYFGPQPTIGIVCQLTMYVIPFAIAAVAIRPRITRRAMVWAGIFVVLMIIWIAPGHFWSIYIPNPAHVRQQLLHEPLNWPIYTIAKTTSAISAMAIASLTYKRTKLKRAAWITS